MEFQPCGKQYREENNTSSLEKVQQEKGRSNLAGYMIDETMPEEDFLILQNL